MTTLVSQVIVRLTYLNIQKWFTNKQMQGNATKCHVLLNTNEKVITKVDSAEIENSQSEQLLGVTIDSQL